MLIEEFVDEEFSMVCEDGSPDEIGEILIQMWRECNEGEFRIVQNVIGKEREREALNPLKQSQGLEGGDAIDENEETGEETPDISMEMAEAVEEAPTGPIIDEDGFETVVRGKRGKKTRGK